MKHILLISFGISILFAACESKIQPAGEPQAKDSQKLSPHVTKLFEYCPAPGQFINTTVYGKESAASALLYGGIAVLSLGAWGGYVIYGFDHDVINHADTADFNIMGNAFFGSSEAGIVFVMPDDNGDGLPNDVWYELKGSEYGTENYMKTRTVTYLRPSDGNDGVRWEAADGESGTMLAGKNNFPAWITGDSYTITAPHVKTSVVGEYQWGYADTYLPTGMGDMDIDNAVDTNGQTVRLKSIRFVKIQTGSLQDLGVLGEFSTEITSIKDLHFN